jgi:RimJ/RimL family protein N-acetyltransferase
MSPPVDTPLKYELKDGTHIHSRLLKPDDRDALREGFKKLSSRSTWFRFLAPVRKLTEDQLQYLTEIDNVNHLAWCAYVVEHGHEIGVGISRYIRLENEPRVAEFAVTVVDEYQNRGIGTVLLDQLIRSAAENEFRTLRGYVHKENSPMLRLLAKYSRRVTKEPGNVLRVDLDLR